MSILSPEPPFLEVTGLIQEIDPTLREVKLLVNGHLEVFDLAPDCVLLLHEERVKLRLLQPLDSACICYTQAPEGRIARIIRV